MTSIIFEAVLGGLVFGIVIGFIITWFRKAPTAATKEVIKEVPVGQSAAEQEKAEHLAKLKEFIAGSTDKITNDQVEKMLGVSNATTERYLDQLEKSGLIKQVGKTGVKTYYEKV